MDYEHKYNQLLLAVASMRKLQKEYTRCKSGQVLTAARRAEAKADQIINAEIAKAIQLQKTLFK